MSIKRKCKRTFLFEHFCKNIKNVLLLADFFPFDTCFITSEENNKIILSEK